MTVCDKKSMPLGYFTCVWEHISKKYYMFCLLILYVIPAIKIQVEVNDVNYDVERSMDIYLCVQADKYMFRQFNFESVIIEFLSYWVKI